MKIWKSSGEGRSPTFPEEKEKKRMFSKRESRVKIGSHFTAALYFWGQ